MLFKSRELSHIVRPSEVLMKFDTRIDPPPLEIVMGLQDIMVTDINSNEELITNMRDQCKLFFFEDLQYFSWNNFISTIQIFCQSTNNGVELLTQILKKEVKLILLKFLTIKKLRFQLKELKGNKNSKDLYKTLNNLYQRIFLLQRHINEELNLSSIILPIVNEELNNLQSYWEKNFIEESISNNNNIVEHLHIFILMESVNAQNAIERIITIFKARYAKIKGAFNDMSQFLLRNFSQFFSGEHLLVNKLATSLTKTKLLSNDLQKIITQDLLNDNIEHFINLPVNNLYNKLVEMNPEIIMAICRILDFPFEKRFFVERYIMDLIKRFCLSIVSSKKKKDFVRLILLKEEFASKNYAKKPETFFIFLDKCIIQVIEETNGVDKLVSILNKRIIENYEKKQKQDDPLIEKALIYLKYQSNYEAFEEAYRTFLTRRFKRMCIYSEAQFEVEQFVSSKIANYLGSEPISLSLTILKDVEISRSISKNNKSFVTMSTFSYISLPKTFQRSELDVQALKRIDSALNTSFVKQYTLTSTAVLNSEIYQKRKIMLLYHGSLEIYFPKKGYRLVLTFVQGLVLLLLLLQSKLDQTFDNLKKVIGLENDVLLKEISPLANPKCPLFTIDGQKVQLDVPEFQKLVQGKAINHFKDSSKLHQLRRDDAHAFSEDAQKRMLEASTVKFLKRKKILNKKSLFELVQADLYRFYQVQGDQFNNVIDLLIQKEYCKKLENDFFSEMIEYLP